ncbi:MAG: hypothetical protein ACK5TQ_00645 [Acetobacteraceae bacterium]
MNNALMEPSGLTGLAERGFAMTCAVKRGLRNAAAEHSPYRIILHIARLMSGKCYVKDKA